MTPEEAAMEQGKVLGMVFMGCDLDIAAHTVGWSEERLAEECQQGSQFAKELALREGSVELHHMRNVHKAAEDVKNWRASTWWLARRAAERRERKKGQAFTISEIQAFLEELVDLVFDAIAGEADRDRLIASLLATANEQDRRVVAGMIGEPLLLEALEHAED
jgi:hypothetical protein